MVQTDSNANPPAGIFPPGKFAMFLIRRKACRVVRCRGFTNSEREDVEQELALRVCEAAAAFDPELSHPHAFLATVIERAAATLVRDRRAAKRQSGKPTSAVDRALLSAVTLDSHEANALALAHDVAEIVARLPARLGVVAGLLSQESKRQAAKKLRISRQRLDLRIHELRIEFVEAGLDDKFLPNSGHSASNCEG